MRNHVMLDLECLGTSPGSVIVSIGAVSFNASGILEKFYSNVSIKSCLDVGLGVDQGAVKFWMTQASQDNRNDLFDPPPRGIREALSAFTAFYQKSSSGYLWSHGSNFDIPVLAAAYAATGHGEYVPWSFRLTRDTRTLFSLAHDYIMPPRSPQDKHNALSDARYQVLCVLEVYQLLGKELEQ